MNDNTPNQNTNDLMDIGKWVLLGVLFVGVVGVVTWIVLNTNIFKAKGTGSTLSFLPFGKTVTTTTQTQNTSSTTTTNTTPQKLIEQIGPVQAGANTYVLTGKLVNVDVARHLVFIRDDSGKTYAFHANYSIIKDETSTWLKVYIVQSLQQLSISQELPSYNAAPIDESKTLLKYQQIEINNSLPVVGLGNVSVRWNDTRTMQEIQDGYNNNPSVALNESLQDPTILAIFQQ